MKIERKENSGLVEFGSLKCGDVFNDIWIKTKMNNKTNCISLVDGNLGFMYDDLKVKHYPDAKLVLED